MDMFKIMRALLLGTLPLILLTACTTVKQSDPPRTASEEMLISTAADRAAIKIAPHIPDGSKTFIDATYFEGTDSKYAISAIRSNLLQQGVKLTDDKKTADTIVEIRSGALSTDDKSTLVGIPSFSVPIPLSSTALTTPELAFYKSETQKGVAKFAATVYNAHSMQLSDQVVEPQYGLSHDSKYTVLFFISWENNDAVPADDDLVGRHVHLTAESTSDSLTGGSK